MSLLKKILLAILALILLGIAGLAVALSHNSPCGTAPAVTLMHPMKAAVYRCYGSPDVIRVEAVETPVPGDHDLLIKVHASSVNPFDWHFLLGEPYIMRGTSGLGAPKDVYLGTDYAGTVVSVGNLVTKFKAGDEVFGGGDATMAEYTKAADREPIALKPANVSFEEAASVPIAGTTALIGLRDYGHLKAGQKVLINGAGGGVGTFAVQIAKALGGTVTAVTNTGSVKLIQSLGADHVIDYTREDFTQGRERYDLIFDLSGNHPMSAYHHALTPTGIYLLAGNTDKGLWLGPLTGFIKTFVYAKFVKETMVPFMGDMHPDSMATLAAMMASGQIKPVIDRRYPLDQVADAFRYQITGHARGKVVVTID